MKFDHKCKPELICRRDGLRESLKSVYLDAENKKLVATNGVAMVVIPCSVDNGEKSGLIPSVAFQWARKCEGVMRLIGKVASALGMFATRPKGLFVDWKSADPGYREGSNGTATISFNPEELLRLCRAMGISSFKGKGIALTFRPGSYDAILVTETTSDISPGEAIGFLMPCRM